MKFERSLKFKIILALTLTPIFIVTSGLYLNVSMSEANASKGSCVTKAGDVSGLSGLQRKSFAAHYKIPSRVLGLRCVRVSNDLQEMTLSWVPNPSVEKVDSYSVYTLPTQYLQGDYYDTSGEFVGIVQGSTITFRVAIGKSTTNFKRSAIQLQLGPDNAQAFWVVAHNKFGWGFNNWKTTNPDGSSPSRKVNSDGTYVYKPGTGIYEAFANAIVVPCTINKIATSLCQKYQWN